MTHGNKLFFARFKTNIPQNIVLKPERTTRNHGINENETTKMKPPKIREVTQSEKCKRAEPPKQKENKRRGRTKDGKVTAADSRAFILFLLFHLLFVCYVILVWLFFSFW